MSHEGIGDIETSKRVNEYLGYSLGHIKEDLGIGELTNIELSRLRETVRECIDLFDEQLQLLDEKKISAMNVIEVEFEAPARWLWRLYGIKWSDIPTIFEVKDGNTGEVFKYENSQKKEFEDKIDEINRLGHTYYTEYRAPEDFKEYLRRKREDSHLI